VSQDVLTFIRRESWADSDACHAGAHASEIDLYKSKVVRKQCGCSAVASPFHNRQQRIGEFGGSVLEKLERQRMRAINDRNPVIGMLRDTLRRFVDAEMPRSLAAKWDAEGIFPSDVYRRLADLGVMALTIPEEYGGNGRNIPATMVVIEELSRRSLAVAVPYIMCTCYGGMNILESGSETQKRELLPRLAKGELLFAFGVTEPDIGADVASVKSTGRLEGDHVVVNGAKRFCTGANIADYIYAIVRTDAVGSRHENLSLLLIPPRSEGVHIECISSMGMRGGACTTDVTFDNVRIPAANIVGGREAWNKGWALLAGPGLDVEKLEVAAMALGIAEAAVTDAWEYAETREQFGRPISAFQAIRHTLSDARTNLHACRLMLNYTAEIAQMRKPCSVESSMAKLFICEQAHKIVLSCQSILGAYGCVKGFDMERYVRDILLFPIVGGSSMIQRNNIANRLRLRQ